MIKQAFTLIYCMFIFLPIIAIASNTTEFPEPPGWDNIAGTGAFNPINASITAWQYSAGGNAGNNSVAWLLAEAAIILLVPTIIYIRTQKLIPATFGMLLITAGMHYYGIVPAFVWIPIYIMVIISLGLSLALMWYNK